jgi:hypothetical protein
MKRTVQIIPKWVKKITISHYLINSDQMNYCRCKNLYTLKHTKSCISIPPFFWGTDMVFSSLPIFVGRLIHEIKNPTNNETWEAIWHRYTCIAMLSSSDLDFLDGLEVNFITEVVKIFSQINISVVFTHAFKIKSFTSMFFMWIITYGQD